jgi:hypothetical protein
VSCDSPGALKARMGQSIDPSGRPWTLHAYAALIDALPMEERRAWLALPVLLLTEGIRVEAIGDDGIEESTVDGVVRTSDTPSRGQMGQVASVQSSSDDRRLVLPLARSKRNDRTDRLSLGRSEACDVMLAFPVVSKVHAYLHEVGPESAKIEDAGSRNGTFVAGVRLERGKRAGLVNGSLIVLGQVALEFRSASSLAPQVLALATRHRR